MQCEENDLHGTNEVAQALANQYIERYRSLGDAVVFCSVVPRVWPLGMSRCHFRQLANAFNSQLRESTSRASHLAYISHLHLYCVGLVMVCTLTKLIVTFELGHPIYCI